jgi:uncharacterized protein YbjT (DUF2867 family)
MGYIGGRLVPELVARGYRVRVMVRAPLADETAYPPGVEVAFADALDAGSLRKALQGVGVAYYLIHSMLLGPAAFARADVEAARNFRTIAEECGVGRIIYLGGLGDVRSELSAHLASRIEVAHELDRGTVPVTILRAAVIIGSGSASYEIIKNLVMKLPILFVPRWLKSMCQPVSIRDVVKYLVGILETPESSGRTFDIGGDEVMSYRRMMETVADVLQKGRPVVTVPFFSIRTFAYIASLITPVPGPITLCLFEGLKNDVVCSDSAIRDLLPFEPVSFRESIVRAMTREEQDRVHTRWSDAYPPAHELAMKLCEVEGLPRYTARYSIETRKSPDSLFASICRIGGREGWFHNNWMWRLRGEFDRLILGVGTSRGRRRAGSLAVNDVIDFWRVEELQENKRLLLRAEMRLPGKAWLDFGIEPGGDGCTLRVTAYYFTKTLFGRIYWYFFLPFHNVIFKGLLRQIERRSA